MWPNCKSDKERFDSFQTFVSSHLTKEHGDLSDEICKDLYLLNSCIEKQEIDLRKKRSIYKAMQAQVANAQRAADETKKIQVEQIRDSVIVNKSKPSPETSGKLNISLNSLLNKSGIDSKKRHSTPKKGKKTKDNKENEAPKSSGQKDRNKRQQHFQANTAQQITSKSTKLVKKNSES